MRSIKRRCPGVKADLSQIFWSFKENSTAIRRKRARNLAKLGFSVVDHVKSDRLLERQFEFVVDREHLLSEHVLDSLQ